MPYYEITSHREAAHAAIAINNIGCTLLERGCYGQAHQTLQDAARAAVVLLGDDDDDDATTEESRASVASKLAAAAAAADQRLALPRRGGRPAPPSQDSKDDAPAPLRVPVDDDQEHPDLVILSAIAVHNSALSCYYQATEVITDQECSPDKRRRLLAKAKTLLKSSYCLVADCPTWGAYSTLTCALHILESLHHVVVRSSSSSSPLPLEDSAWASPLERPGLAIVAMAEADHDHLAGLEAELEYLRFTVQAIEQAERHFFGQSDVAAAA
jgi:hypothetical protein